MTTGAAITIDANNVSIDFNGYKVGGAAAGAGTNARGINNVNDRSNITLHNGIVRGFRRGINISGGSGHLIENMLLDFNTENGLHINSVQDSVMRSNRVYNTGGTSLGTDVAGILLVGARGVRVLDNDVSDTVRNDTNSDLADGIRIISSAGAIFIDNNRVSNSVDSGIVGNLAGHASYVNNHIHNSISGGTAGLKISSSTSIYKDNIVTGFTTPFSLLGAVVDGGGNVSVP